MTPVDETRSSRQQYKSTALRRRSFPKFIEALKPIVRLTDAHDENPFPHPLHLTPVPQVAESGSGIVRSHNYGHNAEVYKFTTCVSIVFEVALTKLEAGTRDCGVEMRYHAGYLRHFQL